MIKNEEVVKTTQSDSNVSALEEFIKGITVSKISVTAFYDLFTDEEMNYMTNMVNISRKYTKEDWIVNSSALQIQEDIVILQSSQVQLSNVASRMISMSTLVEDNLKTERARVRILCKQSKTKLKLNDDNIKDISYVTSKDLLDESTKYVMAAEFCRYLNYSTRDLVQVLDKAMSRISRVEEIK